MAERCVVKVLGSSATSFAACFYNEKKVAEGTAKCIAMRNFGDLEKYFIHSPVVLSNYFQKIADHNSRVKHKQKHMVFSYPGKATPEQLEQLLKDAAETMDRLGYKGQPMVFWVHTDTDNTHIHVASVTVSVENGMWIDNYMEGRRVRRILDNVRGINYKSEIDKLFDYKFESREQFKSLLLANGYRSHLDEENGTFDIFCNHELVGSILTEELDRKIAGNGRNKENHKDIVVDLRGKLMDNRRRSLKVKFSEPIEVSTKKGKHIIAKQLNEVKGSRFNGEKGLDIKGEQKAQFKKFLVDLKQKLGISLVFSQWKDGQTKGYTLIDNKNKIVFKGSDVIDLQKLLNPDWKKGQAKDAIISANDASLMADEISMDKNLPQFLEQQLEKLDIKVSYNKEEAMNLYGGDSEQENRETSVNLYNLVLSMVSNQEDLTEEGEREIRSIAIEAVNRAVCADRLHLLEEEEKARQKAEEEARRSEQEKAKTRSEAAKTMTADRIASFVIDTIDDYNIPHAPGGHEFKLTGMKEDVCINAAMTFLEKAINEPADKMKNANLAIGYARAAEKLHQLKIDEMKVAKAEKPAGQKPAAKELAKPVKPAELKPVIKEPVKSVKPAEPKPAAKEPVKSVKPAEVPARTEPTAGQLSRLVVIREATTSIREKYRLSPRDIEDRLPAALIAKAIENATDAGASFKRENLVAAAEELCQNIGKTASTVSDMAAAIMTVAGSIALPDVQPSLGGGGGSDLPKKKDDEWQWWKGNGIRLLNSNRKRGLHR